LRVLPLFSSIIVCSLQQINVSLKIIRFVFDRLMVLDSCCVVVEQQGRHLTSGVTRILAVRVLSLFSYNFWGCSIRSFASATFSSGGAQIPGGGAQPPLAPPWLRHYILPNDILISNRSSKRADVCCAFNSSFEQRIQEIY
jgi:hypothetical protein